MGQTETSRVLTSSRPTFECHKRAVSRKMVAPVAAVEDTNAAAVLKKFRVGVFTRKV